MVTEVSVSQNHLFLFKLSKEVGVVVGLYVFWGLAKDWKLEDEAGEAVDAFLDFNVAA